MPLQTGADLHLIQSVNGPRYRFEFGIEARHMTPLAKVTWRLVDVATGTPILVISPWETSHVLEPLAGHGSPWLCQGRTHGSSFHLDLDAVLSLSNDPNVHRDAAWTVLCGRRLRLTAEVRAVATGGTASLLVATQSVEFFSQPPPLAGAPCAE